jgi:hypothetical protein
MFEQRAPELGIFGGEVAIGEGDAHQYGARRVGAVAFGLDHRRVELDSS